MKVIHETRIFVSNLQVFKDPSGKSGAALEDYGMCGRQADFCADLGRNGALSPLCYAQLSYRSAGNIFFWRGERYVNASSVADPGYLSIFAIPDPHQRN